MPSHRTFTTIRILSAVAATVLALACGTNYVYSAWAPQFAQRLKLSATESNLIGTFGNLGMYFCGVPFGMLIDAKGLRWGVASSAVLFGVGYYALAKAFDAGPGVFPVTILCLFSFLTGAGSFAGYGAALKAVAVNFPQSRGTATAFPTAAFGLSASAFATVALALPHDTSHFLLLLATGTVALPIISFPFIRTVSVSGYKTLPEYEDSAYETSHSAASRQVFSLSNTDTQEHAQQSSTLQDESQPRGPQDKDDASSLLSADSEDETAALEAIKAIEEDHRDHSPLLDIRGFALLRTIDFWQLWPMLALLAGTGLMTINNIGNDAQALWRYYDPNVEDAFIVKRQVAHVTTLSICSCLGRLLSGFVSDILVNKYQRSRKWCLLASANMFAVAQLLAIFIDVPDLLVLVVAVTGVAYGLLFGVYPSMVVQAFGVDGFSQNWGAMCLAPALSGEVFNALYGTVYDSHSIIKEDGARQCLQGRDCYSKAYLVTWTASLFAILLCSWSIYHEHRATMRQNGLHKD